MGNTVLSQPTRPLIAILCPADEDLGPYESAVRASGGEVVPIRHAEVLPDGAGGLLMAGDRPFGLAGESAPPALTEALNRDLPILGIGWGMHALNCALGGKPPVPVEGHGPAADGSSVKHGVFLSPGGKVSYTIGGSGWVTVNSGHTHGIRDAQRAPRLLASAYSDDTTTEAVELPGRHWVIGVQWRAHLFNELPRGFDNLLLAFLERSA